MAARRTFTQSNCQPDAFHTQGAILVDTADNDVVGGWQAGGNVEPAPSKAYPILDPLAGLLPPTPPTAPVHPCPTYGGAAGVVTLDPGVYNCELDPPGGWGFDFLPGEYLITGGLKMNGGGDATFDDSIITLRGEGLELTGNGTITSTETMFYIEEGEIKLTGTGDMSFTAPSTGDYYGVIFFQARDNTETVIITGNSAQGGWGTVCPNDHDVAVVRRVHHWNGQVQQLLFGQVLEPHPVFGNPCLAFERHVFDHLPEAADGVLLYELFRTLL